MHLAIHEWQTHKCCTSCVVIFHHLRLNGRLLEAAASHFVQVEAGSCSWLLGGSGGLVIFRIVFYSQSEFCTVWVSFKGKHSKFKIRNSLMIMSSCHSLMVWVAEHIHCPPNCRAASGSEPEHWVAPHGSDFRQKRRKNQMVVCPEFKKVYHCRSGVKYP